VSPSDFWGMTPNEVSSLIEFNRPKYINGIHEDDYDKMLDRREELEAQGYKVA
jgi:hypothetical protein